MALPLRTYDSRALTVLVNGIPIGGFADGTFITIEKNTDTFQHLIGVDGEFVRFKTHDNSGVVTLTLNQSSLSNAILQGFIGLDETTNTGAFAFLASYGAIGAKYSSPNAFIIKHPTATYGKESDNLEWRILCSPLIIFELGAI